MPKCSNARSRSKRSSAGLAVDITDRIRAEQAEAEASEALRRQKTRLETLLRVAARLNSLTDRQAVLDAVCVEVRSMLDVLARLRDRPGYGRPNFCLYSW